MNEETDDEFIFLNKLQESGEINMFGAIARIQQEFGYNREQSESVFEEWARTKE